MADNGVLKTVITADPATLGTPDAGTEWRGSDSLGFWIKDENDVVTRPDIGTGINWTELFTTIPFVTDNVWTVTNLGAGFENALVEMIVKSSSANDTVGIRTVGSAFDRSGRIDTDSTVTLSIRADNNGDIELFASNSGGATFNIAARWQ